VDEWCNFAWLVGCTLSSHCVLGCQYGAMDFKIAGTRKGVTAIQLDVKQPLPIGILIEALKLAKAGRIEILELMDQRCSSTYDGTLSRNEPKESAPRVEVVRFDPQRKRDLVGPGGVVLRQLEDRYGVALDLTQEGQCLIFGANRAMVEKAKATVMDLVADVMEGETYIGTVIEIKDFGVIIELLRNKEGILHVSEISSDPDEARRHSEGNLGFVRQQLRVGQEIEVLCIGVDPVQGTVKLSRKALLKKKKQVSSDFVTVP
jgi:polyribonucleotide nucleotidyltransferase